MDNSFRQKKYQIIHYKVLTDVYRTSYSTSAGNIHFSPGCGNFFKTDHILSTKQSEQIQKI
jgi:hypothetical protein